MIDAPAAMRLAEAWANEAGATLAWLGAEDVAAQMLVQPDPTIRTHWRCAIELARLCAHATGRSVPELLADVRRAH